MRRRVFIPHRPSSSRIRVDVSDDFISPRERARRKRLNIPAASGWLNSDEQERLSEAFRREREAAYSGKSFWYSFSVVLLLSLWIELSAGNKRKAEEILGTDGSASPFDVGMDDCTNDHDITPLDLEIEISAEGGEGEELAREYLRHPYRFVDAHI